MKKAVRILLPIFLVLTILLSTVWYFFVYDRDLTKEILLSFARSAHENGNHSTASWFYELAYSQDGDGDEVAIELAKQYKQIGNYTKAESTLSNAISDGGGVALYIELCKTYIEQDKLLDAVNMLNSIANPDIKAQIDAIRPDAPTPSTQTPPGIYNQYITVELQVPAGIIYTSTNGEYPSTTTMPYSEPLQMLGGENTIYTLTVKDGLVSTLAVYGYTVGSVVEQITFQDPAIEKAVRDMLNFEVNEPLLSSDIWNISEFTVPEDAEIYADLVHFTGLKSLTIKNGKADQLLHATNLSGLTELHITNTTTNDSVLESIAGLTQLEKLTISNCNISSIVDLAACTNLIELDISNNTIRNIDAVSKMTALQSLNLKQNVVNDLSAISGNSNLQKLDVSYNALSSIASICNLSKLTLLEANNNEISELGDIQRLSEISYLNLANNNLSDITILANCTSITDLNISSNNITDISALSALTSMLYFDFSYNQVEELPLWTEDSALVMIDGSHNLLSDLKSLEGLKQLNQINMDYNENISSVDGLVSCPLLIRVDIYGTSVKNADALIYVIDENGERHERGVVVNFNPTNA